MEQNNHMSDRALPSTFISLISSAASSALAHAPGMESSVKFSGGVVAAVLATRYAGSLRSACVLGLLSGLFAHSFYVDVLRKKRRRHGKKKEEQKQEKKQDVDSDRRS